MPAAAMLRDEQTNAPLGFSVPVIVAPVAVSVEPEGKDSVPTTDRVVQVRDPPELRLTVPFEPWVKAAHVKLRVRMLRVPAVRLTVPVVRKLLAIVIVLAAELSVTPTPS
jgi:hypothetical protein